jgi:ribosomal protein S27AE
MAQMLLNKGLFARATAACPVCGNPVEMTHAFNGARLRESFGCYRCGPTTYTVRVTG